MAFEVLCLRPEIDFTRAGVTPPAGLTIAYRRPDDLELAALTRGARALVIPAVGGKLPGSLFEGGQVKLVQVTGAGVDRIDETAMKKLGIAVANVPGGSNSAVAEYAVGCAIVLLRRLAWSDREIRDSNYVSFRGRMVADNLAGLEGLTVGVVGMGTVGLAVADAFHRFACQIVYHDPAPRDACTSTAPGFIRSSCLAPIMTLVCGSIGTCSVTMSEVFSSSSSDSALAPSLAVAWASRGAGS